MVRTPRVALLLGFGVGLLGGLASVPPDASADVLSERPARTKARSTAPPLPAGDTLDYPASPISQGASAGYLPGEGRVTAAGEYVYTLPLEVPEGRAGQQPSLSIAYSAGNDGLLGYGFNLAGLSAITRCGRTLASDGVTDGVSFDQSDRFCLDAQKLVSVGSAAYGAEGAEYRTERDSFVRVRSAGGKTADGKGPERFEVELGTGVTQIYEAVEVTRHAATKGGAAELDAQSDADTVRGYWLLSEQIDGYGNRVAYYYDTVTSPQAPYAEQRIPKAIHYTSHVNGTPAERSVRFHYETRPDAHTSWQSGVPNYAGVRLQKIEMFAPDPVSSERVWEYRFAYAQSAASGRSRLASMQRCAETGECLWAKEFQWNDAQPLPAFDQMPGGTALLAGYPESTVDSPSLVVMDVNGDGADDALFHLEGTSDYSTPHWAFVSKTSAQGTTPLANSVAIPRNGTSYGRVRLESSYPVDLDGDGRMELFAAVAKPAQDQPCTWSAQRWNASAGDPGFEPFGLSLTCDAGTTSEAFGLGGLQRQRVMFVDMNGDGLVDLLSAQQNGASELEPYRPTWGVRFNHHQGIPGKFGPVQSTTVSAMCEAFAADFDGDGRGELVTEKLGYIGLIKDQCTGVARILRTSEDGSLQVEDSSDTPVESPMPMLDPQAQRFGANGRSGDFNGDGLEDLLHLTVGADADALIAEVEWNTGNGLYASGKTQSLPVDAAPDDPTLSDDDDDVYSDKGLRLVDFNGDGRTDLATFQNVPSPRVNVFLSKGDGSFVPHMLSFTTAGTRLDARRSGSERMVRAPGFGWDALGTQHVGSMNEPAPPPLPQMLPGWPLSAVGDFNGDGRADILRHADGKFELYVQQQTFPDRLAAVYDEMTVWPREAVSYDTQWSEIASDKTEPVCEYPLFCLRKGMTVVRRVHSRAHWVDPVDEFAGTHTLFYSYEDPVTDLRGRGFLGFGKFRTFDPARPSERVATFLHRTLSADGKYYPYAGLPMYEIAATPILSSDQTSQAPLSATARIVRTAVTPQLRSLNQGKTYAVFTTVSKTQQWEEEVDIDWGAIEPQNQDRLHVAGYSASPPVDALTAAVTVVYDDYGALVETSRSTQRGSILGEATTTVHELEHRTAPWILGLRIDTTTASTVGGETVVRHETASYDAHGRIDAVNVEPNAADTDLQRTIDFSYDPVYGHPTRVETSAPGMPTRVTRLEWAPSWPGAPDEKIHPSQVWAEHDVAGHEPSRWLLTDPARGVTVTSMDANGVEVYATYDGFGRPLSVHSEGEAEATMTYAGRVDQAGGYNGMVVEAKAAGQKAVTVSDALGRTLSTSTLGFDGVPVWRDTKYDVLGRVIAVSRPYTDVPNGFTSTTYDSLDRILEIVAPDQAKTRMVHAEFETRHYDSVDNEASYRYDIDGRLVGSTNYLGAAKEAVETSYEYGAFGVLKRIVDPAQNLTNFVYDIRGRRITAIEPDRGRSQTYWNGFDEVRREEHPASGLIKVLLRDDLGRLVEASAGNQTRKFVWDESPHGIGRIASTYAPFAKTSHTYDALGRPQSSTLTDEANASYTIEFDYDKDGRLHHVAYPKVPDAERFTVRYDYTPYGALESIRNVTQGVTEEALWTVQARELSGALTTGLLGDDLQIARGYDPVSGRLAHMQAGKPTGPASLSFDLTYKTNGLVESRITEDESNRRVEQFDYDSLLRLTHWTLGSTSMQLGAPPAFGETTEYRYDAIGNLTDVLKAGVPMEHRDYGQPGGVQPHTLTTLERLWNGTATDFTYDELGRMHDDGTRSIVYNADDLPETIVAGGKTWTYRYDAFGARVSKSAPGESTLYFSEWYEKRTGAAGIEHVFHVAGSDGAAAHLTHFEGSPGYATYFPLRDALGSVSHVVDANGVLVDRSFYDPFGARIDTNGITDPGSLASVTQGFTGHEHEDELGLINMKGRIYDPAMKRFLTADPFVSVPAFGQAWNPYSYVLNSPLNFTDPSGHIIEVCACPYASCEEICSGKGPSNGPHPPGGGAGSAGKAWFDANSQEFATLREGAPGPGVGRSDDVGAIGPADRCQGSACHQGYGRVKPWARFRPPHMQHDGIEFEHRGMSWSDPAADSYCPASGSFAEGCMRVYSGGSYARLIGMLASFSLGGSEIAATGLGSRSSSVAFQLSREDAGLYGSVDDFIRAEASRGPSQLYVDAERGVAVFSSDPNISAAEVAQMGPGIAPGTVVGIGHGLVQEDAYLRVYTGELGGISEADFMAGLRAATRALERAGIKPRMIDCVVCGSAQGRLGDVAVKQLGLPAKTYTGDVGLGPNMSLPGDAVWVLPGKRTGM